MRPIFIINFKTYETATGGKAVELARITEKVGKATGIRMMVAVQAADIYRVSEAVSIPVLAQHIDPITHGKNTGYLLPETARANGAYGTLLNHSERKIDPDTVKESIKRAKQAGLVTIVCASDDLMAWEIAKLRPDIISVEPDELIGTGQSVSVVRPEVVSDTVEVVRKVGNIPVLCGAGIRTAEDIKRSLELGANGILIASGVTQAEDPEKYLMGLSEGAK